MFCYISLHRDQFPKVMLYESSSFFHSIDVIFDVNGMLPTDQIQAAREVGEWSSIIMGSAPHSYVHHLLQKQSDLVLLHSLAVAIIN